MRTVLCFLLGAAVGLVFLTGCSNKERFEPPVEYYYPVRRQLPREPVYGRLTWSHLPNPLPRKVKEDAPLLSNTISVEVTHSNLEEAVEALAQTIGYRWELPKSIANRRVSIKFVGTAEQALNEIMRQAGVSGELDHKERIIRVSGGDTTPRLKGVY